MHLQQQEKVLKIIHHHLMPGLIGALKIFFISLPFFLILAFLSGILSISQLALASTFLLLLFAGVIFIYFCFYYLDRLVITNLRILHIDWKGILKRVEHEASLVDIQDIKTEEKGVLSFLPFFDYGIFSLETASTKTSIVFKNAPDPEGIKRFIYQLNIKEARVKESV